MKPHKLVKTEGKSVKTEGPVDVKTNYYVPFETLKSTCDLEEAISQNTCVLLVGHIQSGKSSVLRYLSEKEPNYFYIHSSNLANEFLHGLCNHLSLNSCDNIKDFGWEIMKKYEGKQIVILIDDFDQFIFNNRIALDALDQMKELTKLVNDKAMN